MNYYRIEDYFTPEAIMLIEKSEIIGIDGITEHAVVLLSCDIIPYAVTRDGEELIHAGELINSLPCPSFTLSDGLYKLFVDDTLDGLRRFGVFGVVGEDIMFQPWGGRDENVVEALNYIRNYLPDCSLEEFDGLFLFKEGMLMP